MAEEKKNDNAQSRYVTDVVVDGKVQTITTVKDANGNIVFVSVVDKKTGLF